MSVIERVERLDFASQREEFQREENPYRELAETVVRDDGLAVHSLKPGVVAGTGHAVRAS